MNIINMCYSQRFGTAIHPRRSDQKENKTHVPIHLSGYLM